MFKQQIHSTNHTYLYVIDVVVARTDRQMDTLAMGHLVATFPQLQVQKN